MAPTWAGPGLFIIVKMEKNPVITPVLIGADYWVDYIKNAQLQNVCNF